MKILLFLLILTALIVVPCSAENVTIEIIQVTQGDYYISYNDDITTCSDNICIFDVENYTVDTTEYQLSNKDITKIAQRVALEISSDDISNGVNETFLIELHGNTRETVTDFVGSRLTNTVIPELERFDELEQKFAGAETTIADLQSKAREYDNMKETKDETISVLKSRNSWLEILCVGLGLTFIVVLGLNSQAFKRVLELKRRKR